MAEDKSLPNFQTVLRTKPFGFMAARLKTVGRKSKAFTSRKFNFAKKYTRKNRINTKGVLAGKVLSKRAGFQRIYQNLRKRYVERPLQQFLHADLMKKGKQSIWKSMDMVFPTGGSSAPAPAQPVAQPQAESFNPFQQVEGGTIIPRMEVDPVFIEQKRRAALRAAAPKKPVIASSSRVYSRAEEISPGRGKTSDTSNKETRQEVTPPPIVPLPESQPAAEETPAVPAPEEQAAPMAPVTPPAQKVETPPAEQADTHLRPPAGPPPAPPAALPPVHSVQRMPEKATPPPAPPASRPEGRVEAPRIHSVTPTSLPTKIVPPAVRPVRRMKAAPAPQTAPAGKLPEQRDTFQGEKPAAKPADPPVPPLPNQAAAGPEISEPTQLPARQPGVALEVPIEPERKYESTSPAPVGIPPAATVAGDTQAVEIKPSPAQPTGRALPWRPEQPAPRRMAALPVPPAPAPEPPNQAVEAPPLQPVQDTPHLPVEKSPIPEQPPARSPVRIPAEKVTIPDRRPQPAPIPMKAARLPERRPQPAESTEPEQEPTANKITAPLVPKAPPEPKGEVKPLSAELPASPEPEINLAEAPQPRPALSPVPFPAVRASRAARIRFARRPATRKLAEHSIPEQVLSGEAKQPPTPTAGKPVVQQNKARTAPYLAITHHKPTARRESVTVAPKPALPEQPPATLPVEPAPRPGRPVTARAIVAKAISSRPAALELAQLPSVPAFPPGEAPSPLPEKTQEFHPAGQAIRRALTGPELSPAKQTPGEPAQIRPAEQPARPQGLPQATPVRRMTARPVRITPAANQPNPESVQPPVPLLRLAVAPRQVGQVQAGRKLSQQVKQKYVSGQPAAPAPLPATAPAPVSAGTVQRQMETQKTLPKPAMPMPVVQVRRPAEVTGVVQRAFDEPGALPALAEDTPALPGEELQNQPPELNFNKIADQVYPFVIRRLEIEKERHAGKFW
jgi:hypothetical protein